MLRRVISVCLAGFAVIAAARAQYDKVADAQTWIQQRRPQLLRLIETNVYGRTTIGRPIEMTWEVVAQDRHAMGGLAVTKTVKLYFAGRKDGPSMELAFTLPNTAKPVPVFLTAGNARVNVKAVLDRGYGIIACRVDQIQTDAPNGYAKSIRAFFAPPGQIEPRADEWGAIAAWAWGLSRAMDYIETDNEIDAKRVFLNGFSRHAQVALWAGAQDQRFAITLVSAPGFDRSIAELANGRFGYWFDRQPKGDAAWHQIVALHAPRPVYLATAEADRGDPQAALVAAKAAEPVYRLFGEAGLGDFIGYHQRAGERGQNQYDWQQFLNFADRHLKKQ